MNRQPEIPDAFTRVAQFTADLFDPFVGQPFRAQPIDAQGVIITFAASNSEIALELVLIEVTRYPNRNPSPDFPRGQFALLFRGTGDTCLNRGILCAMQHSELGLFNVFVNPVQLGPVPIAKADSTARYYEVVFG